MKHISIIILFLYGAISHSQEIMGYTITQPMTDAMMLSMVNMEDGAMIYNSDKDCYFVWGDGTGWRSMCNDAQPPYYNIADYGDDIDSVVNAIPPTGGIVLFDCKTYVSPYQERSTRLARSNITFQGCGRPDIAEDCSNLEGGTIIQGAFHATADNLTFRDLGIDSGIDYVGATSQQGLVIASPTQSAGDKINENIHIENVSVTTRAYNSLGHCIYYEGVNNSTITDVKTCFSGSGTVIKGENVNVNNLIAKGHGTYSYLVKSDSYAPANNVVANNITVEDVAGMPLVTDALYVQAATADLSNIVISNVTAENVQNVAVVQGLTGFTASNVSISNVTAKNVGNGLLATPNVSSVSFNNILIDGATALGANVQLGADCVSITNSKFLNTTSTAVANRGTNTILSNIQTLSNTKGIVLADGSARITNHIDKGSPQAAREVQAGAISLGNNLIPSTAPNSPNKGDMYYDNGDDTIKYWNGSNWVDL